MRIRDLSRAGCLQQPAISLLAKKLLVVLLCVAGAVVPAFSQKREIGHGQIDGMGVFVYLQSIRNSFVVTLVLTRGLLREDAPLLRGEDFDLELTTKSGKSLRVLERPRHGVVPDAGGPGVSANVVFRFAREVPIAGLGKATIRYRSDSVVVTLNVPQVAR